LKGWGVDHLFLILAFLILALVTGGNSGIGYATAKELKVQGAEVIITGRRKEAVDKAAAELGVTGMVADQARVVAIEELASRVGDKYGKIDILFINAGVLEMTMIEGATEKAFDKRIAAVELAPRKIRVNSVSPGPTATEILNKVGFDADQLKQVHQWMIDRIPLKKIGKAEDVGKMVGYFCGEAASFITGAEVVMDGGMSL
jgi:NAD(P)-dependent dehydrogenase (short-subunit alcohol dehydrogenase family)